MFKKVKKLYCFDLDGTLVATPLPDEGRLIYEQKTGKPWPHTGWWSKKESLDISIFDIPVIESVIEAYNAIKDDPEALIVMMTGRVIKLSKYVERILEYHGLVFDRCMYNTGGSTLECKCKSLDDLLVEFPSIEEVHLFDDRLPHIPEFEKWGASKEGLKFGITVVPGFHHHNPDNNVKSE